eukprot:scaffold5766_cov256-Pinguiococcus_pyrenoidosus.AAC.13
MPRDGERARGFSKGSRPLVGVRIGEEAKELHQRVNLEVRCGREGVLNAPLQEDYRPLICFLLPARLGQRVHQDLGEGCLRVLVAPWTLSFSRSGGL